MLSYLKIENLLRKMRKQNLHIYYRYQKNQLKYRKYLYFTYQVLHPEIPSSLFLFHSMLSKEPLSI